MIDALRRSSRAPIRLASLLLLLLTPIGCGESDTSASGSASSSGFVDEACNLVDDVGGPGQYADSCVQRAWVEPYVGVYSSATCTLTITTPSAGPAAVFELVVTDAALGGTYTHDWEGGTGVGNDSYYRFTTDASFATTKAESFGVGRKVSETEEHTIGFRADALDTATPTFSGYFGKAITSPFSNEEVDCGALVLAP